MELRNSVIYELYVRSHTPEGTFRAVEPDLDLLNRLQQHAFSSRLQIYCRYTVYPFRTL